MQLCHGGTARGLAPSVAAASSAALEAPRPLAWLPLIQELPRRSRLLPGDTFERRSSEDGRLLLTPPPDAENSDGPRLLSPPPDSMEPLLLPRRARKSKPSSPPLPLLLGVAAAAAAAAPKDTGAPKEEAGCDVDRALESTPLSASPLSASLGWGRIGLLEGPRPTLPLLWPRSGGDSGGGRDHNAPPPLCEAAGTGRRGWLPDAKDERDAVR